jgi:hypothetical protein
MNPFESNIDEDFVNQFTDKVGKAIKGFNPQGNQSTKTNSSKTSDPLSLMGFDPLTAGVGASFAAGSALLGSATNEHGVVDRQNRGKAIIGGILNPIQGLTTLARQPRARREQDRFRANERAASRYNADKEGAFIQNTTPKYQPLPYGRKGLKTKFSSKY